MLKLLYFFISLGSYSFASRVFLPTNPPSVTWRSTTAASSNLKTKCNRLQTSTRGIASYVGWRKWWDVFWKLREHLSVGCHQTTRPNWSDNISIEKKKKKKPAQTKTKFMLLTTVISISWQTSCLFVVKVDQRLKALKNRNLNLQE